MRKFAIAATVAAVAVAAPAQAKRPDSAGSQRAEQGKSHERGSANRDRSQRSRNRGSSKRRDRCAPRKARYIARGLLVSHTLLQTAGADTETRRDDRFSGDVVVDVKRTNRHARADRGETKTYAVTDVRVRFADRDGDETRDMPEAGDRVSVAGWTTRLHRRCDATGFTPEMKIRRVKFHGPKPAPKPETPAPAPAPAP